MSGLGGVKFPDAELPCLALPAISEQFVSEPPVVEGNLSPQACVAELRAICAIMFGLSALFLTFLTFSWLMSLFVVFLFADGMLGIAIGCLATSHRLGRAATILAGLGNGLLGSVLILLPALTVPSVAELIGLWSVVIGGLGVATALQLNKRHGREMMLLAGAASIAWGALLCMSHAALPAALAWWLGAYALALGCTLLALAPQLRTQAR